LDQCRKSIIINNVEGGNNNNNDDPLATMIDAMADCMSQQTDERLAFEEDERSFESYLRSSMARQIPTYACGDVEFETTEEILNSTWSYEQQQQQQRRPGQQQQQQRQEFLVTTFHKRPTSKIVSVSEFVVEQECEALRSLTKGDVVPFDVVNGNSAENRKTHALAARMYALAATQLDWKSLDFQEQYNLDQELFDIRHDKTGAAAEVMMPGAAKCVVGATDDDDDDSAAVRIGSDGQVVVAAEEDKDKNKDKSCRLPGASPMTVSTSRFEASGRQVATIFVFCEKPAMLGGIHFPYAGVHINPKKGTAVMAVHRYPDTPDFDGYAQEYHLCPNHHVYSHTLSSETTNG
jgi:hypothetical protein